MVVRVCGHVWVCVSCVSVFTYLALGGKRSAFWGPPASLAVAFSVQFSVFTFCTDSCDTILDTLKTFRFSKSARAASASKHAQHGARKVVWIRWRSAPQSCRHDEVQVVGSVVQFCGRALSAQHHFAMQPCLEPRIIVGWLKPHQFNVKLKPQINHVWAHPG